MSVARLIGHLLLWTGFLCGAFVAVRRTEIPEDPWATISWLPYYIALGVALAGVVQLRRTKREARDEVQDHAASINELETLLEKMRSQLAEWQAERDQLEVYEVHRRIDEHLSDDLATFADRRQSLIDAFGLEHYAHVMTQFALAERTINRMWSASADGYIDEVNDCLPRAIAHLEAALGRIEAARNENR